jgi:hypothetical protein
VRAEIDADGLVVPAPALDHAELVQQRGLAVTQETLEDRLDGLVRRGCGQADVEIAPGVGDVSRSAGLCESSQMDVHSARVHRGVVPGQGGRELTGSPNLACCPPRRLGGRETECRGGRAPLNRVECNGPRPVEERATERLRFLKYRGEFDGAIGRPGLAEACPRQFYPQKRSLMLSGREVDPGQCEEIAREPGGLPSETRVGRRLDPRKSGQRARDPRQAVVPILTDDLSDQVGEIDRPVGPRHPRQRDLGRVRVEADRTLRVVVALGEVTGRDQQAGRDGDVGIGTPLRAAQKRAQRRVCLAGLPALTVGERAPEGAIGLDLGVLRVAPAPDASNVNPVDDPGREGDDMLPLGPGQTLAPRLPRKTGGERGVEFQRGPQATFEGQTGSVFEALGEALFLETQQTDLQFRRQPGGTRPCALEGQAEGLVRGAAIARLPVSASGVEERERLVDHPGGRIRGQHRVQETRTGVCQQDPCRILGFEHGERDRRHLRKRLARKRVRGDRRPHGRKTQSRPRQTLFDLGIEAAQRGRQKSQDPFCDLYDGRRGGWCDGAEGVRQSGDRSRHEGPLIGLHRREHAVVPQRDEAIDEPETGVGPFDGIPTPLRLRELTAGEGFLSARLLSLERFEIQDATHASSPPLLRVSIARRSSVG